MRESSRRGYNWAVGLSLKQAVRRLKRTPSFALTAIGTLALCIGCNATLLSFLVTLTWRPQAGVRDGGSLTHITLRNTRQQLDYARPSELQALRSAKLQTLTVASYAPTFAAIGSTRTSGTRVLVEFTSPKFFDILQTRAIRGRLLVPRDTAADLETPVVVSERLWRSTFATAVDIVGQRLYVDGRPAIVVGVAEARFHGPEGLVQADAWLPVTDPTKEYGAARVLGRLQPGSDIRAARAELRVAWQNVQQDEARRLAALGREPRPATLVVLPLRAGLHPEQAPVMQRMLGGAVAVALLVLLIACVNLAGLTLSRVLARGSEIAVRAALGSSRVQLWANIGTEVAILFLVGTGLGLLIATLIGRGLMLALTQPFPFTLDVQLNGPTLALSLALMSLAIVSATVIPGLQATRVDPANALRADSRSTGVSKTVRRVQGAFVVVQITSAVLLLAGVVSSVITMGHILNFDIGVRSPETLAAIESRLTATPIGSQATEADVILDRVRQLPSVISAVRAYQEPAGGSLLGTRVRRVDSSNPRSALADEGLNIGMNIVSAGFFATVGTPVLRGREFTANDDVRSSRVALLSRRAAAQLFPGTEAVGHELAEGDSGRRVTIVGVVDDILYDPSRPEDSRAIYLPAAQSGRAGERVIVSRVRAPTSVSLRAINAALSSGPDTPIGATQSVDQLLRESTKSLRAIFALLLGAAGLAVTLALAGVYGMIAYDTRRREREIGVRLALGANPADVALVLTRSVFALAAVGAAIALIAWPLAGRILPDAMRADTTAQWLAIIVASAALGVAAVGASFAATWRPAHADPMRALRAD